MEGIDCPLCKQQFSTEEELITHKQQDHSEFTEMYGEEIIGAVGMGIGAGARIAGGIAAKGAGKVAGGIAARVDNKKPLNKVAGLAEAEDNDEGWGSPEETAKDIYDLGHPEKAEEDNVLPPQNGEKPWYGKVDSQEEHTDDPDVETPWALSKYVNGKSKEAETPAVPQTLSPDTPTLPTQQTPDLPVMDATEDTDDFIVDVDEYLKTGEPVQDIPKDKRANEDDYIPSEEPIGGDIENDQKTIGLPKNKRSYDVEQEDVNPNDPRQPTMGGYDPELDSDDPNDEYVEEGGPGSGKPALLPEQTARAGDPHYNPFKATPPSERLQTDPALSRMTEDYTEGPEPAEDAPGEHDEEWQDKLGRLEEVWYKVPTETRVKVFESLGLAQGDSYILAGLEYRYITEAVKKDIVKEAENNFNEEEPEKEEEKEEHEELNEAYAFTYDLEQNHRSSDFKKKELSCTRCNETFYNLNDRNVHFNDIHMKASEYELPDQCPFCKEIIQEPETLDWHMQEQHGAHIPSQYTQTGIQGAMADAGDFDLDTDIYAEGRKKTKEGMMLACDNCGSTDLKPIEGLGKTTADWDDRDHIWQGYHCNNCGFEQDKENVVPLENRIHHVEESKRKAREVNKTDAETTQDWWQLISEAGGEGDYMQKAAVNGPDNTPNWEWGDPIMWEEFSSSQQQALTNAAGGIGGMQERLMNEGWSDYNDEEDSYESISNIINEADFKEEDHPRDGGKFTSKGGGDTGKKSKSTGISKDNLSSLKKDAKGNQDLYSLQNFDPQMHVDSKIYKKIHKDLGDPKMEDSSIDDKISSYIGGLKLDPNKKGNYMKTQFGESKATEHISDAWWWKDVEWESGFDQDFLWCKTCRADLYAEASWVEPLNNVGEDKMNRVVPDHLKQHGISNESKATEDHADPKIVGTWFNLKDNRWSYVGDDRYWQELEEWEKERAYLMEEKGIGIESRAGDLKKEIKNLEKFIHYATFENPLNMGSDRAKLEDLKAELASLGEANEVKSEMELKHNDWGNTLPFWCLTCGAGGEEPEDIEAHYDLTGHGKKGESRTKHGEGDIEDYEDEQQDEDRIADDEQRDAEEQDQNYALDDINALLGVQEDEIETAKNPDEFRKASKHTPTQYGMNWQKGEEQDEPVEKWDKDDDIGRNYAEPTGDDEPLDDDSYWQGRMEESKATEQNPDKLMEDLMDEDGNPPDELGVDDAISYLTKMGVPEDEARDAVKRFGGDIG